MLMQPHYLVTFRHEETKNTHVDNYVVVKIRIYSLSQFDTVKQICYVIRWRLYEIGISTKPTWNYTLCTDVP